MLPVSQNTALFALIGTTYGGDGRTTTALPNLQGRAPMHPGRGPGLTSRSLGQRGGAHTITLSEAQMPNHNHSVYASQRAGNQTEGVNGYVAQPTHNQYVSAGTDTSLHANALENSGGSQAHNNLQPFLTMNFIIALVGLYPSRG